MAPPKKKKGSHSIAVQLIVLGSHSGLSALPCMKIKVFETDFHVLSKILKLYSAFFEKFLDPSNKSLRPEPLNSEFKYECITVADIDGTSWCLSDAAGFPDGVSDTTGFIGNKAEEIQAFQHLLSAIYGEPYCLHSVAMLRKLTELSDYYLALPAVSRSLDGLLQRCPQITGNLPTECLELFFVASKLHHKALFNDCLIHLLNPYPKPKYLSLIDPELKKMTSVAYGDLSKRVLHLLWEITKIGCDGSTTLAQSHIIDHARSIDSSKTGVVVFLRCLRAVLQDKSRPFGGNRAMPFWKELDSLFERKSLFCFKIRGDYSSDYRRDTSQNLYCLQIDDESLPWDTTQTF